MLYSLGGSFSYLSECLCTTHLSETSVWSFTHLEYNLSLSSFRSYLTFSPIHVSSPEHKSQCRLFYTNSILYSTSSLLNVKIIHRSVLCLDLNRTSSSQEILPLLTYFSVLFQSWLPRSSPLLDTCLEFVPLRIRGAHQNMSSALKRHAELALPQYKHQYRSSYHAVLSAEKTEKA